MKPENIQVGIVSLTFFNVPVWAARDQGLFAEEGVEVALPLLGNASQVEPLTSGAMNVVIGTCEAVLQNAASGGPLRVVAGNTGKLSHSLIVNPRFDSIEDMKKDPVKYVDESFHPSMQKPLDRAVFELQEKVRENARALREAQDQKK